MNRLLSLQQLKQHKPTVLSAATHTALARSLRLFSAAPDHSHLSYSHRFPAAGLPSLLEKMSRIGWAADEMDHHPEWTLQEGSLAIRLSTHDIGNRLSVKDYVLAGWIEQVLESKGIEEALCESWNGKGFDLEELK